MSNLLSSPFIQGYGPAETIHLPCVGPTRRATASPQPVRTKHKPHRITIPSLNCSLRHPSTICKASSGNQRRNSDFSRQNKHLFSRNKNRHNDDRDNNSDNFDDSEFLSTKNGPLLSLSNSPKSQPTASPGPREREIVELFRKVQAKLRERAAIKEEKKVENVKGQNKENETVDSLLKLLRKHSVEQGKRKVNGGNSSEFGFDRVKQSESSNEDKGRNVVNSDGVVREETNKASFSRPLSNFRRRSPVPRVRYESIVSTEPTSNSASNVDVDVDVDETTSKSHPNPNPNPEPDSEFYSEPDLVMDLVSGLEDEDEDEDEDEEIESDSETDDVDDESEVKDEVKHTKLEDLNAMKVAELKELAKARGLKGFSKLKKSELVGLLTEDSL